MKKLIKLVKIMLSLLILSLLIFSADNVRASCLEALLLCGRLIIPSLFPFFVLSAYITRLGLPGILGRLISPFTRRIYGISPAGASALMMGFVGGYPAGAVYISELAKEGMISPEEGERLLAFCNNSGPAFIVGVMGSGIFGSVKTGLVLYAVHILSALICGLFFRAKNCSAENVQHRLDETDTIEAIVASVRQAVSSILNVSGFMIFFSVLVSLMDTGGFFSQLCTLFAQISGLSPKLIKAAFIGLLELGSGSAAMAGSNPSPLSLAIASAMLSWGGLSVHFQTMAVLSDSKIKGSLHLAGRLISAITAFILMYAISLF